MPASTEEIKASLERHNAEFEALLSLIPSKYYLVPEDSPDHTSKYQKNVKKQKAPKQAIKEASKKAKREKLDPANNKSIVELQEEAASKKAAVAFKRKGKEKETDDGNDDFDSEVDNLERNVDQMDVDENVTKNTEDAKEAIQFKPMSEPASVETLRANLRARMEELRQKNGRKGATGDPGSKNELLEERRKQRAEMRERRRKETKEKKRREREEEENKRKGKEKDKRQMSSGQTIKSQLLVPDVSGREPGSSDASSRLTNVAFSNLAGSGPSAPKSLQTSSNPKQALEQLSKRTEARAFLPEETRKELEERDVWAKANSRVSGAKVHDDPARLQKAAKRREKEKTKSKREWEARKDEAAKAQAARQKKRADNLAMRHEKKKGKKGGKSRPGFEGKGFGGGAKKKAGRGAGRQ